MHHWGQGQDKGLVSWECEVWARTAGLPDDSFALLKLYGFTYICDGGGQDKGFARMKVFFFAAS